VTNYSYINSLSRVAPNILVISQGEKRRSAAVLVGDAGLEPAAFCV
jgi:hypothetical protein